MGSGADKCRLTAGCGNAEQNQGTPTTAHMFLDNPRVPQFPAIQPQGDEQVACCRTTNDLAKRLRSRARYVRFPEGIRLRHRWDWVWSVLRFDADVVVDGDAQFLFAAEVPLGRLHADMPEEQLDLLQFASSQEWHRRAHVRRRS